MQPGLGALAELRRIKWFQHVGLRCAYLPDMCRLIRGLAIREPSWRSFRILCPWSIALILEQIIKYEIKSNGGTSELSPSKILFKLLESLAKGFRFPVIVKEEAKPDVKAEGGVDALIHQSRESYDRERKYTHKLIDPCEAKKDYDALSHISSNRKGDIRACAKYALDLIERNQICLLLNTANVEGLEDINKPGRRQNTDRRY